MVTLFQAKIIQVSCTYIITKLVVLSQAVKSIPSAILSFSEQLDIPRACDLVHFLQRNFFSIIYDLKIHHSIRRNRCDRYRYTKTQLNLTIM